jgi:hypothetical protein
VAAWGTAASLHPNPVRVVLVLAALAASSAPAAPLQPRQRLLLGEVPLHVPPRPLGLAGAYVAVAESADGLMVNPASALSRDLREVGPSRFDLMINIYLLPVWAVQTTDWDNDGVLEQPAGTQDTLFFHGGQLLYVAATLNRGDWGFGLLFDGQNYLATTGRDGFAVQLLRTGATAGHAFLRRQLHVGVTLETSHVLFGRFARWRQEEGAGFHGLGAQVGLVYRPDWADFRLGLSARAPQVLAGGPAQLGGLTLFDGAVVPARISLGGSLALGKGRPYNLEEPEALPRAFLDGGKSVPETALGKWLISAQVDLNFPAVAAASLSAFFAQAWGQDAPAAMSRFTVTPRVGVEKDVVPRWLRVRGGLYLEPPLVDSARYRPHVTLVVDAYLLQLGRDKVGVQLGVDFAPDLLNVAIGLLVPWK